MLRNVAGGWTLATDPVAADAARKLLSKPKTPPLTQAQAETLAIVAYLQPVSRPEISRIRGVAGESAVITLTERGLIEESGRSRFGASIYRTTELFERVFGLAGLDDLPDPAGFDPTPEVEGELRDRLLKAGEVPRRPAGLGLARRPRDQDGDRSGSRLSRSPPAFRRRAGPVSAPSCGR